MKIKKYQIIAHHTSTGRIVHRGIDWDIKEDAANELREWARATSLSYAGDVDEIEDIEAVANGTADSYDKDGVRYRVEEMEVEDEDEDEE